VISAIIIARCTDDGTTIPIELLYDPAEPYAVSAVFCPRTPVVSAWTFARSLLDGGLQGLTGRGDVRIWPRCYGRGTWITMALTGGDDEVALFDLPSGPVREWLSRTYRCVPRGSEAARLDLDAVIASILGGVS
jgi:hypothetical protein